jgi:hypothetical protein
MTASAASAGDRGFARARLRNWYSNELESKVARAVTAGHVTASQAADLHRLVHELLDDRLGAADVRLRRACIRTPAR